MIEARCGEGGLKDGAENVNKEGETKGGKIRAKDGCTLYRGRYYCIRKPALVLDRDGISDVCIVFDPVSRIDN